MKIWEVLSFADEPNIRDDGNGNQHAGDFAKERLVEKYFNI